jgi:hypothetical protein
MPSPFDFDAFIVPGPPRAMVPRERGERGPRFPGKLLFVSLLVWMACTACGAVGSAPAPPPPAVTVTVTPSSAAPYQGATVQFHVTVENASSSTVNWQVNGATGGNSATGMIDASGLYSAPASVPNPPTVTVTAVLQSDPSRSGSASVTIQALSGITALALSPALASVTTSQALQLQIVTAGVTPSEVSWAVDGFPGGNSTVGTISASGLYTPPTPPGSPGEHTVTAVLLANPGAIGSATVEVTDFPGNLTWRNDNARSGINSHELVLSPATVNSASFGKLFSCPIDGYAYAQPLYVPNLLMPGKGTHNVVLVATEKDSVYAFDADEPDSDHPASDDKPCQPFWMTTVVPLGAQPIATPNLQITSSDIVPFVGITGTPAIDPINSVLYVVAEIQVAGTCAVGVPYCHFLYAINLATGEPVIPPEGLATPSLGAEEPAFEPTFQNQRPALLLDNGTVYIGFGSYGDEGTYHGWLFAYDAASLQQTALFDATPKSIQGGIWQSGGGPAADSNHNVFLATGDGPPNEATNYADSVIRLATVGGLSVTDYFTPCDQSLDSGVDPNPALRSESTAPLLLPDSAGTSLQPHLLIDGSKEGYLYVLNRDNMGQFISPCPDSPSRVQMMSVGGPILSTPLFWNNAVYVAPGNGHLLSFPMTAGILARAPSTVQSPETLGPLGATPVLSANGSNNAILWLIDTTGYQTWPAASASAILRAYDPSNLSNEIYNSAMNAKDAAGPAVKFTVPTVANGKVYVGTQTELDVYGLLP